MPKGLLNVLVVHDSEFPFVSPASILYTTDLDLCRIERRSGETESYLQSWEAVLEILAGEASVEPTPDILLIDARFEKDRGAPVVAVEGGDGATRGPDPLFVGSGEDPRGMLYGAVLAARLLGPEDMPVGFSLYSLDLPGISTDPYAQTFFGLLAALGERVEFPVNRGAKFAAQMEQTPAGGMPNSAWPEALKQYRANLWGEFGRRFAADGESFAEAAHAARDFVTNGDPAPPEDLQVCWCSHDGKEHKVLLRSLYAELRHQPAGGWNRQAIENSDIFAELDQVIERTKLHHEVAKTVATNLAHWYENHQPWATFPEQPLVPWTGGHRGALERSVAFITLRALNLADITCNASEEPEYLKNGLREFDAKGLARFISLGVTASGIDRTMRRALGDTLVSGGNPNHPLAPILAALQSTSRWPAAWPAVVKRSVLEVLDELSTMRDYRSGLKDMFRPRWLRSKPLDGY